MSQFFRRCAIFVFVSYLAVAIYGTYRLRDHGLPHRQINELTNWGQGRAPESNHCPPGTFRFETDDGLFLECFRGK